MSETFSQDTKFSPEANGGLMCSEMSYTKPMTAFFENRGIAPETYDYNLCMAAIEFATTAQAEQIAALEETKKMLSSRLDAYEAHGRRCDAEAIAALTAENARLREAIEAALSAQPADPSGLLRLVAAMDERQKAIIARENIINDDSFDYIMDEYDLAIAKAESKVSRVYEALDPAIKAAAERSGK